MANAWALGLVVVSTFVAGCAIEPDEDARGLRHRDPIESDRGPDERDKPQAAPLFTRESFVAPSADSIGAAYAHLDPDHVVPKPLLARAVSFFDANKSKITNQSYVSVVDFARHSGERRLFIIDMKTGAVRAHAVAHGKMSDPQWTGYATTFSNVPESNMSSLGFAVTGETYSGSHGRSLRLEGLSPTNSNMYDRAIVIHSADYVVDGQEKQGRSLGCFVVDQRFKDDIIDLIQGGSLFYADKSS